MSDVTLLLRPALADAIAGAGLRVSDLEGRDRPVPPSALRLATDPAAALAEADIVLVTVKSGDTAAMAELIAEHGASGVTVVSLQNGIGNVDVLLSRLGGMARDLGNGRRRSPDDSGHSLHRPSPVVHGRRGRSQCDR